MPVFIPKEPTTVLIVENEAILRMELTDRLAAMGLTVLSAAGADEAIALLDAHPEITVLMTDVKMPGSMDGARLARHARDRWPPLKIIVASGMPDAALADLPIGALVLPKPFWPEALSDALDQVINGGAPRAPRRVAGAGA